MKHNEDVVFRWARTHGLELAPHGKTTMAPALWGRVIDAGAWALTLATLWQVQCARAHGVDRIILANPLVDPGGLRWIRAELRHDPELSFTCWVDSPATVEAMSPPLDDPHPPPIDVVIELGFDAGRTGARDVETALRTARIASECDYLRVVGVGGYEGILAHDRDTYGVARVDAYLHQVRELHHALRESKFYGINRPIITVGGSAFPDRVAAIVGDLSDEADIVLRSGAFQLHDDVFYDGITPFGREVDGERLQSAVHLWARVLSRPEPGLALLDAGRRDAPFDSGLPVVQRVQGLTHAESARLLLDAEITELNDQHAYLVLGTHVGIDDLPVGSVVRLGVSHPCSAMDRWRVIPLLEDADSAEPSTAAAVTTWF